jgi:hypothetical protein
MNSFRKWYAEDIHIPIPCIWLLSLLLFLQFGCAPKIYTFNLIPTSDPKLPIEIKADSVDVKGTDGTTMFRALQLTFPGKVLGAAYDPDSGFVLAKYSPKKDTLKTPEMGKLVLYDIDNGNLKWAGSSNATIEYLGKNMATLKYKDDAKVYSASVGYEASKVKPGLSYFDDDTVFCINDDKVSRVDLYSGMDHWKTAGVKSQEYYWPQRDQGWIFYISDGLHGVRLSDGSGWYLSAPTRRSSQGKAIAAAAGALVALNVLTSPLSVMWVPTGIPRGSITIDMCSRPHINGDSVYYSASNDIYCLDRTTGDTIWQTKLIKDFDFEKEREIVDQTTGRRKRPELVNKLGFMGIWDAGPQIAMVGMGFKFMQTRSPIYFNPIDNMLYNQTESLVKDTDPPFIDLIDRNSGAIQNQIELDKKDWVMDFLWSPNDIYLLTLHHLYHFDNNLEIIGVVDADTINGNFLGFLSRESSPLVIRTENGVFALDKIQYQVIWKTDAPLFHHEKNKTAYNLMKNNSYALFSAENSFQKSSSKLSGKIWVNYVSGKRLIDVRNNGKVLLEIPAFSIGSRKGYSYWYAGKNLLIYKEPEL